MAVAKLLLVTILFVVAATLGENSFVHEQRMPPLFESAVREGILYRFEKGMLSSAHGWNFTDRKSVV